MSCWGEGECKTTSYQPGVWQPSLFLKWRSNAVQRCIYLPLGVHINVSGIESSFINKQVCNNPSDWKMQERLLMWHACSPGVVPPSPIIVINTQVICYSWPKEQLLSHCDFSLMKVKDSGWFFAGFQTDHGNNITPSRCCRNAWIWNWKYIS